MGLVNLKCTNCGSILQCDVNSDAMICPHCGSAFVVQNAINNYNSTYNVVNNINADVVNVNSQDINSMIKRAFILLENKNFEYARELLNEVLKIDPENSDANLGVLFATFKVSDLKEFLDAYSTRFSIVDKPELNNAIKYGNGDIKDKLITMSNNLKYRHAMTLYTDNSGKICRQGYEYYEKLNNLKVAHKLFTELKNYKDSEKYCNYCKYEYNKTTQDEDNYKRRESIIIKISSIIGFTIISLFILLVVLSILIG